MKHPALILAALLAPACSMSFRTVGSHDATIDIVREMTRAQVDTVQAITAAFVKAQATECRVPEAR